MKTLAILTNGGDTCALNASIKSIRDSAYCVGYKKIYGVRRGYQGLLDGTLEDITHREIDVKIGGSCLGSMRMSPTKKNGGSYKADESACDRMARTLAEYSIDVLVVIGGDGTLQATRMFQDWVAANKGAAGFRTFELLGFLKTIDNDIRSHTFFRGIEVSLCPGFPSAVKKIVTTVEGLRTTARTAERAFCVETMGRDAGWLAAAASFGGAEVVLTPELLDFYRREFTGDVDQNLFDRIWSRIADLVVSFYRHNRNVIVAVAEGFNPPADFEEFRKLRTTIQNLYGPRKQVGATELVAMSLNPVLDLYFWCLSRLGGHGLTQASVRTRIASLLALKEEEHTEYARAMKSEGHPLKQWSLENKLLEGFGIDNNVSRSGTAPAPAVGNTLGRYVDWDRTPECFPPYHFEIRPHKTDYGPRSGAPSAYDYRLATVLGWKVGELLEASRFGVVPCLSEVVRYERLDTRSVITVKIEDIQTLRFESDDYYDLYTLNVSDEITDFFRTVTSGPQNLDEAIADTCSRAQRRTSQ